MPTNVFFSPKVTTEQNLYEDIAIESIKMYGQDVYYLPRTIMARDYILGEDIESKFGSANLVEMYIENTEGFEGEGNIFQKFGMEIRDEATFIVARRSWQKLVTIYNSLASAERPLEGDLIYLPLSKTFFEISFVEHEQPFYQISNLPTFKLQCRAFEFNDEDFETGIAEIDRIEALHAYTQVFDYGSANGTFQKGERIKTVITAADSASGTATATYTSNLGTVTGTAITNDGFGYTVTPTIIFSPHGSEDKVMNGGTSTATITSAQAKFNSFSAYLLNATKYHFIDHSAALSAGTVEFWFKAKASSTTYSGIIAIFGDFKIEIVASTCRVFYKSNQASVAIPLANWNHVKVSVTPSGSDDQIQIYVNGSRLYNVTQSSVAEVLIGSGGTYLGTNQVKLVGLVSAANTAETNGIYFDGLAINSAGLADDGTISVPSSQPTGTLVTESFEPIVATGTVTLTSGRVTAITVTNVGKFYGAVPTATISTSQGTDIAEVNVSAELQSFTTSKFYIHDVETSDGKYHEFAASTSVVGITSGATASVTKTYDVADSTLDNTFVNDLAARNFNFEDAANDVIDFSESNPFGDPSDDS